MSEQAVVTRFAPSPSGALHLGNARTALFSLLLARRSGGRFLLRIEDTDSARSSAGATEAIFRDLRWLGLDWDGEVLHQSRRRAFHDQQLQLLAQRGLVYPCFCSQAQLEQDRHEQAAAGLPPRYVGRCRWLAPGERERRVAGGEPHALRFRVPGEGTVDFDDLVHGPMSFRCADIGDFVVRRPDGTAVFFFGNAVDDAASGVNVVLRGEDHLANTPRQILLLRGLGLPVPRYGHLSLLLGRDGRPLSKRDQAASLHDLREEGYLPAAINNLLFRLGHSTPDTRLLDLPAMAAAFNPAHLQRASAHFDPAQLAHWQKLAAHGLDGEARARWLAPALTPERFAHVTGQRRAAFLEAIAGNVLLPGEAQAWAEVVFGEPPAVDGPGREAIAAAPRELFAAAAAAAAGGATFREMASAAGSATGLKGSALYKPLRAALTGRLEGPDLGALVPVMGADAVRQRLQRFA